jgi:hypothetical protein
MFPGAQSTFPRAQSVFPGSERVPPGSEHDFEGSEHSFEGSEHDFEGIRAPLQEHIGRRSACQKGVNDTPRQGRLLAIRGTVRAGAVLGLPVPAPH